ncbi:MAG: hypothetical protein RBS77_05840 [Candidatus Moranbacteria bacterium]|jgi:hypothetical protein|nr:hypothetical protein [Candidatus Moranbacteria bacterium]
MQNKKISTAVGTIVLLIIATTALVFVWKYEKNQSQPEMQRQDIVINKKIQKNNFGLPDISIPQNFYSNSDYGFSFYLPQALSEYVVQVSPGTISRVSFLLPVTNESYTKQTRQTWSDVFNILIYPKEKFEEIKQECFQDYSKFDNYKCKFKNGEKLAENDEYFFYYSEGGVYMSAYPQAFEDAEYIKSKSALATLKTSQASLTYEDDKLHVFNDSWNGYEIKYPSDWTASLGLPSNENMHSYVQFIKGPIGLVVFDNNYVRNALLYNNSIEENLKIINLKANITGVKSTFKEVGVGDGKLFYSPVRTSISSKERAFFIIGKNSVFNGTFQVESDDMSPEELDAFVKVLSNFKFLK